MKRIFTILKYHNNLYIIQQLYPSSRSLLHEELSITGKSYEEIRMKLELRGYIVIGFEVFEKR